MKPLTFFCHSLAGSLLASSAVFAAEGSVRILSPADGATLDVMEQNKVEYTVDPGPRGDHVHFYVDDAEVAILRQLEGSYTLGNLDPGEHDLCVKVVNKAHTPIGIEECIKVTMQ